MTLADGLDSVALRHRERFVTERSDGRRVARLDAEADRRAAIRAAIAGDTPGVLAWLSDVPAAGPEPKVADALVAAAEAGWGVAVAIPANDAERPRAPIADVTVVAKRLAARFDAAELVPQRLAEASIIAPVHGRLTGRMDSDEDDARIGVHAWLVLSGLAGSASDAVAFSAATIDRAYLAWLDGANAELRRANVRLARGRLGKYDSAGAWNVKSAERLADLLEIEKQVAAQNHSYFEAARRKLHEPHHRIAEGIVRRLRRIPGARLLGRLVAKLLPPAG